jgi:hypothetical protein
VEAAVQEQFHPLHVGISTIFLLRLPGAFDVNTMANCSVDFIVYTGNAVGGVKQQDIVTFNDLCGGLQQSRNRHHASEVRWLSANER